ncbi:MAG: agglutinin biogenesis protein MshP [Massilia sp.]
MTKHSLSRVLARRRSAGVGLVTAIFLLVVMAGLGVAMVTIFTSQQQSSSLDEQGARGYQAARAGIEWGLFQRLRNGWCTGLDAGARTSTSFRLPATSALSGFTVSVTCSAYGSGTVKRWVIKASACNQPDATNTCAIPTNSPDYVKREVEVEL